MSQRARRLVRTALPVSHSRRVDFIVCGTQKGGTSALDAYLRTHPQLCMADTKEVHFFDKDETFSSRSVDYKKYHAFFAPEPKHSLLGETTPIYMYCKNAPDRMWRYNSDLRLIISLRNPIDRAYSHWNMARTRGVERLDFLDAIQVEQQRLGSQSDRRGRAFSYIDRGFYSGQIDRLWKCFPKEQVLILRSEDLRQDPMNTMNGVFGFLGVPEIRDVQPIDRHSRDYESRMTSSERDHLRAIYACEIRRLEQMLGWDCSSWLQ